MRDVMAMPRDSGDPYGLLFEELSEAACAVYGKITGGEPLTGDDKQAVDELESWGLVGFDPDKPGKPIPLDPGPALKRRTHAQLQQIAQQTSKILKGPQVADLLSVHFDRAKWQSQHGCLYLAEREEVNARIRSVFADARTEILTAQPGGPRTKEHRDIALRRDRDAMLRGVRFRTVYRDSAREDPLTREWAQTMTGKGAAYRTLAGPFEKLVIVDRRVAFILDHVSEDTPEGAAWLVTDRPMVAFIGAVFDDVWMRATPWVGEAGTAEQAGGTRTTRIQRAILRDTAAGIQQDVTAKRLGVSLRRLQRELAELKESWDAPTPAALTYMWALSPDRLIDDGPGQSIGDLRSGQTAA
jgi:hypothetical protein